MLFYSLNCLCIQGWIQHDLVGGGALVPTAELCRSCVPPDHQLLYLNCNCSQFTYHHVINNSNYCISFCLFCFIMKNSTPSGQGWGGRVCTPPPSKSIPACIFSVTPLCNIILQCINIQFMYDYSYVICDSISILVNDILFCSFLAERSG